MNETMKGLLEEMGPLSKRMLAITEKLNVEKRAIKAEEQSEWDSLNKDYDALKARYDLSKVAHDKAQLPGAGDRSIGADQIREGGRDSGGNPEGRTAAVPEEVRSLALQAWFTSQVGKELSPAQREACRATGLNVSARELVLPMLDSRSYKALRRSYERIPAHLRHTAELEQRNMTTLSGAGGGFLVPPGDLVRSLEINMLAYGGMRQVATPIRTSTGERIPMPTADDTGNSGVQLGEGGAIGSSVDPKFGLVYLDAYKFSTTSVLIPFELIQDSAFDLGDLIGEFFGDRLGRITNKKFTTGTGSATPNGIVTAAATGVTSANSGSVVWADFINLIHSLDPSQREGARFMWHDNTTKALRLLVDTAGRPLWTPLPMASMQSAAEELIGGLPYTVNQDMASSFTSGNVIALCGRLFKYRIRTVGELRVYHLVERYRDNDMDAFIGFIREDGNLLQAGTPPVKKLTAL